MWGFCGPGQQANGLAEGYAVEEYEGRALIAEWKHQAIQDGITYFQVGTCLLGGRDLVFRLYYQYC
jgi:hypothetical protein